MASMSLGQSFQRTASDSPMKSNRLRRSWDSIPFSGRIVSTTVCFVKWTFAYERIPFRRHAGSEVAGSETHQVRPRTQGHQLGKIAETRPLGRFSPEQ